MQDFGVNIGDKAQADIRVIVGILAPVIAGLVIRAMVYAPATVERLTAAAHDRGAKGQAVPVVTP